MGKKKKSKTGQKDSQKVCQLEQKPKGKQTGSERAENLSENESVEKNGGNLRPWCKATLEHPKEIENSSPSSSKNLEKLEDLSGEWKTAGKRRENKTAAPKAEYFSTSGGRNFEPQCKAESESLQSTEKCSSSPSNKQEKLEHFDGQTTRPKVEYFPSTRNTRTAMLKEKCVEDILHSKGNLQPFSPSAFDNTGDSKTLMNFSVSTESPPKVGIDLIRRPNFGTEGNPIALVSNFFLLKGTGNDVYQYDVEITPKAVSGNKRKQPKTVKEEKKSGTSNLEIQQKLNVGKQRCRQIIEQVIKERGLQRFCPFYDGQKNLYTFRELPISENRSLDVNFTADGRTKTYTVTLQPAHKLGTKNVISLDLLRMESAHRSKDIPREALLAFETLLCHRDSRSDQVSVGRSFFSISEMRKSPLDGQTEIWKGYNQSVNLTLSGPAVVVNVATKAFHSAGFVIEYACEVLGFDITIKTLSYQNIQELSKNLSNVKVEVTHLPYPRRYTVVSVSKVSAEDLIVDIGNQRMSVAQFFAQKYKKLKFPALPCLAMKTSGKPTYTPMECCVIIPGQPKLGKLNSWQTSKMIKKTAVQPEERFATIEEYVRSIKQKTATYVNLSGFKMETTPLSLNGRVIVPPSLAYENESEVRPNYKGMWRIDGKIFSKTSRNVQWALISFGRPEVCNQEMLERLSFIIVQTSKKVGLYLNEPLLKKSYDFRITTHDALVEAKNRKVDFVFAILSRIDNYHSYDELKFIADVKLGLVTQCMEDEVVSKCCDERSTQIVNNVFSKLNIKLGGINHILSKKRLVSMEHTMVMGADVAHSPRDSVCPSIAAVVGNVDDVPFQYAVACKVQENPNKSKKVQEIILKMEEMTKHILESYKAQNNSYPPKIIFFRDGVSEGQFSAVLGEELSSIQAACKELVGKTLPVTFIVVQKRHQVRFKPRDLADRRIWPSGNVPPGTTVDTDVVHPVFFDYFLYGHEGIKGTSRPAHYLVLYDDNKFQADELQQFSYDLCHVYARCNRSISIPAPAMNAHLAAARAKKYIDWHLSKHSSRSSCSGSNSDKPALPQEVLDSVNNISRIKAPMFFV